MEVHPHGGLEVYALKWQPANVGLCIDRKVGQPELLFDRSIRVAIQNVNKIRSYNILFEGWCSIDLPSALCPLRRRILGVHVFMHDRSTFQCTKCAEQAGA